MAFFSWPMWHPPTKCHINQGFVISCPIIFFCLFVVTRLTWRREQTLHIVGSDTTDSVRAKCCRINFRVTVTVSVQFAGVSSDVCRLIQRLLSEMSWYFSSSSDKQKIQFSGPPHSWSLPVSCLLPVVSGALQKNVPSWCQVCFCCWCYFWGISW